MTREEELEMRLREMAGLFLHVLNKTGPINLDPNDRRIDPRALFMHAEYFAADGILTLEARRR